MNLNGKQVSLLIVAMLVLGTAGLWVSFRVLKFTFQTAVTEKAWRTHMVEVTSNQGDILEVGMVKNEETVENRTEYTWWGVYLGTNYSRIRIPVTYRYHIKLSDDWQVGVTGTICRVKAPAIRPSLPPAIHTDGIERYSERGWARLDSAEHMDALERSLTDELSQRAGDEAHVALIRDAARKSVAEFVKRWLLERGTWKPESVQAILVRFADEEMPVKPAPEELVR